MLKAQRLQGTREWRGLKQRIWVVVLGNWWGYRSDMEVGDVSSIMISYETEIWEENCRWLKGKKKIKWIFSYDEMDVGI